MNNDIAKTDVIFNESGDQVLEERQDGSGKVQTIKYGLIKLVGEKQERRVSFRTLLLLYNAKDDEAETILIRELNMTVRANQIAMMRSETEKVRTDNAITNLPTNNIILGLDFKISPKIRPQLLREQTPYYEAVAHYVEREGKREYYLQFDKIKRLLKVEFDENGYDYISEIYEYGVKK